VLNLGFLAFGVNHLAMALERSSGATTTSGIPPPGCRSWWSLRLLPILICLGPVGVALERGQADLLVLALLCGMLGAVMARRSIAAGLWLSGAICLKVFPLYLLVYPLWRRDWRLIASCALGLLLGLFIIPAAFLGTAKTLDYTREWNRVLVEPGLVGGKDRSRAGELLDINATDSQSLVALIHRWHNLDETIAIPRRLRSRPLERWATAAHWATVALLTALTVLAAGWAGRRTPFAEELFLGALAIIMLLASPVSHFHYFTLAVPLAAGLLIAARGGGVYPRGRWRWLLLAVAAANVLPLLPGLEALRDLGLASIAALALWCAAMATIRHQVEIAS
jgi:alpha-1,2-mannosyltransferase